MRSIVSCTGQDASPHPASGQWKREPGPYPIVMCGSPPTRVGIAELHIGDVPGVDELQGGGGQHRGIHATKTTLPSSPPNPLHSHQTAKGQKTIEDSILT